MPIFSSTEPQSGENPAIDETLTSVAPAISEEDGEIYVPDVLTPIAVPASDEILGEKTGQIDD